MSVIESRVSRKKKANLKVTSAAVDSAAKVFEQEQEKRKQLDVLIEENQALNAQIASLKQSNPGESDELVTQIAALKGKVFEYDKQIAALQNTLTQESGAERFKVWLPVSKRYITCKLIEIEPDIVDVPSYNRRDQGLLSLENASLKALYDDLSVYQKDPVLVRHSEHSHKQFELVYGSRRCYCLKEIRKNIDPDRKLKAWFSEDIPLPDARVLSVKENEGREAISPWEQAQYIHKLQEQHPDWNQSQIAQEVGFTQATVSKYLSLQGIPSEIVMQLETPILLTVSSGKRINAVLNQLSSAELKTLITDLSGPYDSPTKLIKAMNDFVRASETKSTSDRKKQQIASKSGKLRAKWGPVRGKSGQIKIDLFDVTDDEIKKLQSALERIFK